jgi:hypothetical protein
MAISCAHNVLLPTIIHLVLLGLVSLVAMTLAVVFVTEDVECGANNSIGIITTVLALWTRPPDAKRKHLSAIASQLSGDTTDLP